MRGLARRFHRGALTLALTSLLLGPGGAAAQQPVQAVTGVVTENGTTSPVAGAMVVVLEGLRPVAQALSGTTGRFQITLPRAGRFTLRVDRLGYASTFSEPFDVAPGVIVQQNVESRVAPIQLAGVSVEGSGRCDVRPAEGQATAVLWEEVRKALAAAAWTRERGMYQFAWTRFQRELAADGRRVLRQEQTVRRDFGAQPFMSLSPEVLARDGFIHVEPDSIMYAAPDASVLLSDAFLDTHCFTLEERREGGEQLIGLAFKPLSGRRLPDIEGVLWIGRQTLRLRSVEYRYVNLPWLIDRHNAGGEVYFRGLPNGTWIVNEWTIRMLRLSEVRDDFGRVLRHDVLGYSTEGSVVNVVATTDGTVVDRESGLGGVRGVVADSAGRPLSGARVWIQGTDFVATSGSGGRFEFEGVGAGVWSVGASQASLDAIGHQGTFALADVARGEVRDVRVELPSLRAAATSLCVDAPPAAGSDARVLVGRVLDPAGRPVPNAAVRVMWSLGRVQDGVGVQSDPNGRFALCDVPATLRVRAWATLASLESDVRELPATQRGSVARVDLALESTAAARPASGAATAADGTEVRWLATKGFELRGSRALLHQTRDQFEGRGLESIEKILTQVPRVEAKKLVSEGIEYRLHAFEGWQSNPEESPSCPLGFYLNGSLVQANVPTLLGEYTTRGALPSGNEFRPLDLDRWIFPRYISAVEVFDVDESPVQAPGGCGAALFWVHRLESDEDPEFTGSLSGRVMRVPANAPVEGVKVTIQPLGLERTTDRFGRFEFGSLPAARYRVDVVVPEWGPFSSEVMLRAYSRAEVTLEVQPPPASEQARTRPGATHPSRHPN
jgi:hypothetical protein